MKQPVTSKNAVEQKILAEFERLNADFILKKGAKPFKFTSIYEPKDVLFCVELKSSAGPFKNDEQLKKYAEDFKNRLKLLRKANGKIEMIYLSMKVTEARKEFFQRTEKYFGPEIKCFKICEGALAKLMRTLHV